jgi:hypothetical protein
MQKYMLSKRGAVTAFLIVGVVLLVISGIIFLVRSEYMKSLFEVQQAGLKTIPQQAQPLVDYITYCIESTGMDGVAYISERGWKNRPSVSSNINRLPYFLDGDKILMPTKQQIATELSEYVDENLEKCTSLMQSDAFTLNLGKPKTNATINANNILLNVNYPVEFAYGNFSLNLDQFQSELKFSMDKMYIATSNLLNEQAAVEEGICLSCMFETGIKNSLYFQYYTVSDAEYEITIKDYKSLINNKPYTLIFAIKNKEAKE